MPNRELFAFVKEVIKGGHTATIRIMGYSMRPFLEHRRDKVLLDKPDGVRVGDAVLAEVKPGVYVLHRIIRIIPDDEDKEMDRIVLMGDGNLDRVEPCRRKNICAKVTQYIYPDRTVQADDPALVKKIRLWWRLFPVRRYLLVIYKAML